MPSDSDHKKIAERRLQFLITGALLLLLVSVLLMAAVPPVSRDALTHHLAVPKLYLKSGGMHEIPAVEFSYYPMNLDLLYLIPLYFGNDIIPKYIHFVFALLTAWMIFTYLKKRTSQTASGLLGALLFLSLPVVIKLSITAYVDLGLVFFSTAALLYILKWAANGFRYRHLWIAGVFCGLGLGTKYNGLISLFLLTCFIPILYLRTHLLDDAGIDDPSPEIPPRDQTPSKLPWRAFQAAVLFFLVSILVFSPWMIRNWRWTGNPVYPLYQKAFETIQPTEKTTGPDAALNPGQDMERVDGGLGHFALRKKVFNESFLELISTPIRIFFQGQDDNPKYFDGRLNPYLFLFPFLAFIGFKQLSPRLKRENIFLMLFSVLFLLFTFFQIDMRTRYIAPIIPPLVILSVLGLHQSIKTVGLKWTGTSRRLGKALLIIVAVGLLVPNAIYLIKQFRYVNSIGYLSGAIDRDAYIARYRKEYPAIQFINRHLAPGTRLLAVYLGNRIYYSDREMVSDDNFMKKAIATAESADDMVEALFSRGFSHVFIRADFFKVFVFDYLSPEKRKMVNEFFATRTVRHFSEGVYHVLEIKDAGPSFQGE